MSPWRPTAALVRALAAGGVGVALAVVLRPARRRGAGGAVRCWSGRSALLHRPRSRPRSPSGLEHAVLREGQGTRSVLDGSDLGDVEHVARSSGPVPQVVLHPAGGRVQRLVGADGALPAIEVGPRRWGRAPCSGTRRSRSPAVGRLPVGADAPGRPAARRAARARRRSTPAPRRRSRSGWSARTAHAPRRRRGVGHIRPFRTGDRLRRINWRVSLRTGELHVVAPLAERDTGVLLVVDALADHGVSGGIDGAASSLDVTVRAAAALAEHHLRRGDRVALRVVGSRGEQVGYGAGSNHLRRLQLRLARLVPNEPPAGGRPAAAARHPRHRRAGALADAGRRGGHRHRRPAARRAAGARRRHARRRGPSRPRSRAPDPGSPTWPGGCAAWSARPCSTGWPRWPARWSPGAVRARSTTCCAGWPGAPGCPGCVRGEGPVRIGEAR